MSKSAILLFLILPNLLAQTWPVREQALTGSPSSFSGNTHSWADVDGDGDYDLYTDNQRLWINDVNVSGVFINRADLLPSIEGGVWSAAFGDFNNDGKPDLHLGKGTTGKNSLLENVWPGPFSDVAVDWGYDDQEWVQPVYWADYNNDGLLDIYVTHELPGEPHEFWQNKYPGDFEPRFPQAGGEDVFGLADINAHAYGLAWGDIDIDGDIDVVTSACGTSSQIPGVNPHNKVYENAVIDLKGAPKDAFRDRSLDTGLVDSNEVSAGSDAYWAHLFDYDNDGFPDLFIGDNSGAHRLWHNTGQFPGDFGFELVPPEIHGLSGGGGFGHTAVAGDWDNDGDLDIYMTRNGLYRNDGTGAFTLTDHIPVVSSFRDASFVDYNGDGQLDLLNQNELYMNPGANSNHWLSVELVGDPTQGTTRSGNGVKIRVTSNGKTQIREHRYQVGTYSQHLLPTHFGLGSATVIEELAVIWPNGSPTTIQNLSVDQHITIIQDANCGGSLTAAAPTSVRYCQGDVVVLAVTSSNGAPIKWRVRRGPSKDPNQFDNDTDLTVQFSPNLPGRYELAVEYLGCPETTLSFDLIDTDFNGDGAYGPEDLMTALPYWQTGDELPLFDIDGNGRHNLLDMLSHCP